MEKGRDIQLDCYQALIMMYIIGVIHLITWLHVGHEPYVSVAFFEMPVIFFISGAAISASGKKRTFKETIYNRFKRVMIPYYIYAFVALILIFLLTLTIGGQGKRFNIFEYGVVDIIKIITGHAVPQMIYAKHLWFIIPYFLISCSIPLQQQLMSKYNITPLIYLLFCFVAFVAVLTLPKIPYLRQIFGYNVFFVAGMLYYKKLSITTITFCCIAALAIIFLLTGFGGMHFSPMESNKYSSNVLYLAYGFFSLSWMAAILSKVRIKYNKLLDIWNKRGYSLYLYQSYAFILMIPLKRILINWLGDGCIFAVACALLLIAIMTLFILIITPFENKMMSLLLSDYDNRKQNEYGKKRDF